MATPFPLSHSPVSTMNCTTGTLKHIYIFVPHMPYPRISHIKKVFNPANAIQRRF